MKRMKKNGLTIIAMVMMMGFTTSVFAQVPETHEEHMGTEEPMEPQEQMLPNDEREHMRTEEQGVFPQEQNQMGEVEYTVEIEETELPATVTTSLDEMYPDYDVEKVYQGTDDSYKVKIKKDNEKTVVFYDSQGNFVKEEKDKDKYDEKEKDW